MAATNQLAEQIQQLWLDNHNEAECREFAMIVAQYLEVSEYKVHIMFTNLTCLIPPKS